MPFDPLTGEFFTGTLAAHRAAVAGVGSLFFYAARPDAFAAWTRQMMTLYTIETGTTGVTMGSGGSLIGTGAGGAFAAGAIPVVVMVGVWVALGSGYYEAREQAKVAESKSGFAHGFVMGILEWKWAHLANNFQRPFLRINKVDEQMDVIRVRSYHGGLKTGFGAGSALPAEARKGYRIALRKLAGRRDSGQWSRNQDDARNQQISYVIDLAAAAVRSGVIKPQ